MPDSDTLLSHIARWHTIGREDVATDALAFILSHSTAARSAFADFLGDGDGETESPAIAAVRTQYTLAGGAAPDLAGLDADGAVLALVESKFWAGLTANQPVAYWNALPTDAPATLLFLAPAERINPGGLWDELVYRLEQAGHHLAAPVRHSDYHLTAHAQDGSPRRLMLSSWKTILDHLGRAAWQHQDAQAAFEIAQLQGLANSVIIGANPSRDDNRKSLVTGAVRQLAQAGWADTEGLGVGTAFDYWGRFMRLAGVDAWFGINFDEARNSSRPLWLAFTNHGKAAARCRLAAFAPDEPIGWEARYGDFCIPIPLSPGADNDAALNSLVARLTEIARLIDPDGPTYKDASNA